MPRKALFSLKKIIEVWHSAPRYPVTNS